MENQITQSSKPNRKKEAILSLLFGIISLINGIGVFYLPILIGGLNKPLPSLVVKYIHLYGEIKTFVIVTSLVSLTGIILGKIGLNSTKRHLSVVGITFSVVGLIGILVVYFLMWVIAKGM